MLLIGRIYIALGHRLFGDFRKIFLPNIGENQKKASTSERGAVGTLPYGKSGPWLLH